MREEKLTYIHKQSFADVLKFGGSKILIDLPSCIERIVSISFFISNSIMQEDIANKLIFSAVDISLILFSNNQSILNYSALNNQFYDINGFNRFSFESIKIPVFKKNINNTKSVLIFKKSKALEIVEKDVELKPLFENWKPTIEMYIEYE